MPPKPRAFQQAWVTKFPWVIENPQQRLLFCKTCRSIYGNISNETLKQCTKSIQKWATGSFVKSGSPLYKSDVLASHAESKGHKHALHETEYKKNPHKSEGAKCVQMIHNKERTQLENLFRNTHALMKNNRPFSDLSWVCELDEKKGLKIGDTYKNDKSAREFSKFIALVEKRNIANMIQSAKFLSVISDGSTDVSSVENEIIYVSTCIKGERSTNFVKFEPISGSANSENLTNALVTSIREASHPDDRDPLAKLVAFGADSASVNTGEKTGVIARLRQINHSIIMIKCMAHKVELMYTDTFKNIPVYQKLNILLKSLYSFYKKSPKQRSNLKQAHENLKKDENNNSTDTSSSLLMPKRVSGTRWASHQKAALDSLWSSYYAFIAHLTTVAANNKSHLQPKAICMLKLLRSTSVIKFGQFLTDVLIIISSLSRTLQKKELSVHACYSIIKSTRINLRKLKTKKGHNESSDRVKVLLGSPASYKSGRELALERLCDNLDKRFSDLSEPLLKATKIADLSTWPSEYHEDFGDEEVGCLTAHFEDQLKSGDVSIELIPAEWTHLVASIYQSHRADNPDWVTLNKMYKEQVPNVLDLIDLILTIPASSSECERGFSKMKLMKTECRNKLSSETMTDILTIQLHSPTVADFDPAMAIELWESPDQRGIKRAARRPSFMKSKKQKLKIYLDGEESVSDDVSVPEPIAGPSTADETVIEPDNDNHSDYDSGSDDMDSIFSGSDDNDSDEGLFDAADAADI